MAQENLCMKNEDDYKSLESMERKLGIIQAWVTKLKRQCLPLSGETQKSQMSPDSFVSTSCLENKEMNVSSSSIDKNLFYNNKLNDLENEKESKLRFSHCVKNKINLRQEHSNENDEKENSDDESTSIKSRKVRKHRISDTTLKDLSNRRNLKKIKLFNPYNGVGHNIKQTIRSSERKKTVIKQEKQHAIRSSNRERKIVSYKEMLYDLEDSESTDDESTKKISIKVRKPHISDNTLKDLSTRRNSKIIKLFNPKNGVGHNIKQSIRSSKRRKIVNQQVKQQPSRSSNRERKIVNYAANKDDYGLDDSQNYSEDSESTESSESEEEHKKKAKKKVESPGMIVNTKHLSAYEQMVERNKEANRRMLEEMGIFQAKNDLVTPTKKLGRPK